MEVECLLIRDFILDIFLESETFEFQQATNGISQISFGVDEDVTPKKPITLNEAAKQRELSGTIECEWDSRSKKHTSDAKSKELSGNDIFGPPPEVPSRSMAAARTLESKANKDMEEPAPRNVRTSVKVSNVSHRETQITFPLFIIISPSHENPGHAPSGRGEFVQGLY